MLAVAIEPYESSLEILPIKDGMKNRVMLAARRDGELTGHLCLTFANGLAYGHDTKCWDSDPYTALRLWLKARAFLKSIGYASVIVHVNPADKVQGEFWERRGFKKTVLYQGEI